MKKEELDKQIDGWLKRRETIKPFIDRMVKLNVRREELLQDMKQLQEDYIKALPFKVGDKVIDEAGNVGWQFSINSTDDAQREYLFSGNALPLRDIAELADTLETPRGRKYTLNFALADDSIIDGKVLASMFDPRKFMCKITPLHRTNSCEANHIQTSGGYDSFVPYKKVEEDLKANGFDVIVFVPSYDEDNGLITCGNAILSGKKPTSSYKEVVF